jgi:hypothetical protein
LASLDALGMVLLERPWGLALMLLPLLLWVLSRLRPRPEIRFTGALRFWEIRDSSPSDGVRPQRAPLPPVLLVVIAALMAGAVGMGGLGDSAQAGRRVWRVLVDCSPSMYLGGNDEGALGQSRLERGIVKVIELMEARVRPQDSVEWVRGSKAALILAPGELPDAAWLSPSDAAESQPQFRFDDRPGTIWLTDAVPDLARTSAGLVAVGGGASPGLLAVNGSLRVDWDGRSLTSSEHDFMPRTVRVELRDGSLFNQGVLHNPLAELFLLWARERHFELAQDSISTVALVLSFGVPASSDVDCFADAGRWTLGGRGSSLELDQGTGAALEKVWQRGALGGRSDATLVAYSPGRIRVAWSELQTPSGSPAAFALAWSEFFDACLGDSPGVISLDERQAPGAALSRLPSNPAALGGTQKMAERWSAWLAGFAALLALVALVWDHGTLA